MISPSFFDLGLSQTLCMHLASLGYNAPTQIQAKAIPPILWGQDLIACAQTGSGKTASFLLPLIHVLQESPVKARMPRALILEPTRELAQQVYDALVKLSNNTIKASLLVGGESSLAQQKLLTSNPDVLIATPGRILDFIDREKILLFGMRFVVVDEADRMLDMGFLPDVQRIFDKLPLSRQTLLFSATFDDTIAHLTSKLMLAPKHITASELGMTADKIEQFCIKLKDVQKRKAIHTLAHLLNQSHNSQSAGIIFCNRKRSVDEVAHLFKADTINVKALHGDLGQSLRNITLEELRDGKIQILIASDVAARGLDIKHVDWVINFDIPTSSEDYVHRIGRTGRAGREGRAYSLVTEKDKKTFAAVEKLIQMSLPVSHILDEHLTEDKDAEPRRAVKEKDVEVQKPYQRPKGEKRTYERRRYDDGVDDVPCMGFGTDIPTFFKAQEYKHLIQHSSNAINKGNKSDEN